jgi:dTDP-4-dehydrorhamnose reductase
MTLSLTSAAPAAGPLILGGSGKLGRALARVWPKTAQQPVWQSRYGAEGTIAWDILNERAPDLPPICGVIVLAGVTSGDAKALALNTTLGQAGCQLAATLGVPALVASTQAVYGRQPGLLSETAHCAPLGAYGQAKLAMEAAAAAPHVTFLRIGNIAGCDTLADAMTRPPVVLDRFADGQGPRRAMLGVDDMVQVLLALLAGPDRPPVLNLARPGLVAMADLLAVTGTAFIWRMAAPDALQELALDVTLLQGICPLPPADATAMAAQGWRS